MLRGCGGAPTRCPGGALPAGTLIGCLPNNMLAVHAGSKLGELSSFRELYSAVRARLTLGQCSSPNLTLSRTLSHTPNVFSKPVCMRRRVVIAGSASLA